MGNTLKQMLVLAALVAAPVTMNAQIGEGKAVPGEISYNFIPKAFTVDGKSYLYEKKRNDDGNTTALTIYNDELEAVKSFTLPFGELEEVELIDVDGNSFPNVEMHVSQTLFNADEKYEVMLALEGENGSEDGFQIMSEDGAVLQSVKFEVPDMGRLYIGQVTLIKINDKYYLAIEVDNEKDGNFCTYTIFYSITPQTSEIKAVKSIPGSFAGQFSLDGRRQAKLQRGVNIVRQSDGTTKKLLVK